jgi:hypothetical protein
LRVKKRSINNEDLEYEKEEMRIIHEISELSASYNAAKTKSGGKSR